MRPARERRAPHRAAGAEPDGRLVERVRQGEAEAFAALVRRHQARLYRHARGMGLSPDVSEDMVQDAFVAAWEKLDDCHDPERFGLWVYRILRHRCLDHLKDVRRRHVPLEDVPLRAERGLPERDEHRARVRDGVRRGLDALTPVLREAFLMKHHLGLEYAEMAELEGVSVSAMKMRVQRAREALKRTLEELELEPSDGFRM